MGKYWCFIDSIHKIDSTPSEGVTGLLDRIVACCYCLEVFLGISLQPWHPASISKYFIVTGCQGSDRESRETKCYPNSNCVEEKNINCLIKLTCRKLGEMLEQLTVQPGASLTGLFAVSAGMQKHTFTGCDAVPGCPTTEPYSDCCSNKELVNQQANVQSSLLFHTLTLEVSAQIFWCVQLPSDSCSGSWKKQSKTAWSIRAQLLRALRIRA